MRLLPWLSSLAISAKMLGKGVCVLHQQHFLQDRPLSVDREVDSKHLPETHPGLLSASGTRHYLRSSFCVSDFNDEKTNGTSKIQLSSLVYYNVLLINFVLSLLF